MVFNHDKVLNNKIMECGFFPTMDFSELKDRANFESKGLFITDYINGVDLRLKGLIRIFNNEKTKEVSIDLIKENPHYFAEVLKKEFDYENN